MKLRFTTRDLLWLAALVAVSVGWWLDHKPPTPQRYRIIKIDMLSVGEMDILQDTQTGEQRPLGKPYPLAKK